MNDTIIKFGYPNTCLIETKYWCVLLRPIQITIGSLVIVYKDDSVHSLSRIAQGGFSEFAVICRAFEEIMASEFDAKKFNYLALMMVDQHVHFHALPRYEFPVEFEQNLFADEKWPGPPDMRIASAMNPEVFEQLNRFLAPRFRSKIYSG